MSNVIVKDNNDYLKFYCNGCGDTFDPNRPTEPRGFTDISPEELPKELQEAYKLWTECGNFLTYIAEVEGSNGIVLVSEFDEEFCIDMWSSMDEAANKLQEILENCQLENAKIFLNVGCGFKGCHEVLCYMPWNVNVKTFCNNEYKLAKTLDDITGCSGTIKLTPEMFKTA